MSEPIRLELWNDEHESRLNAMIDDEENLSWDLSPNDRKMLVAMKAELARLRTNSERWRKARRWVCEEEPDQFTVCFEYHEHGCDADSLAFEAAVDAAIAAEKAEDGK